MQRNLLSAFFLLALFQATLFAQPDPSLTWREIVKLADELHLIHQFAEAAEMYLLAYDNRSNRMEFLEKAAESYASDRQYAKALPLFENLMENRRFPLAGLRYAQMLKHDEQYEKSMEAFRDFRLNYDTRARNSTEIFDLVQREIRGINTVLDNRRLSNLTTAEFLSDYINSETTEIAPFFHKDWLYFTSTQIDKYAIFRSQIAGADYLKPIRPVMFRQIGDRHFAGGSFSHDGRYFYFSVCDEKPSVDPLSCNIYAMEERDGLWSEPVPLPEIINTTGFIQAHPQIVRFIDREYLLFSSNHAGGHGGMDIWYSWKPLAGDINSFSRPVNAGTPVNTPGHEVSPHFNTKEQKLYFSSNFHSGFGGYDVFAASGEPKTWRNIQNLGLPVNSGADDWYYTTKSGPYLAMWSSNRKSGEHNQTAHDNIYALLSPESLQKLSISGHVHHLAKPSQPISRVNLSLYALDLSGQPVLIQTLTTEDGDYKFNLRPERKYQLTAAAYGYFSQTLEFSTEGVTNDAHVRQLIELEPEPGFSAELPPVSPVAEELAEEVAEAGIIVVTDEESELIPETLEPVESTLEEAKPETGIPLEHDAQTEELEIETPDVREDTSVKEIPEESKAPEIQPEGDIIMEPVDENPIEESPDLLEETPEEPEEIKPVYKIQLAAVVTFVAAEFEKAIEFGKIEQETAPNGLIRILLSSFESEAEARIVQEAIEKAGFEGSFVVRYTNGYRSVISR